MKDTIDTAAKAIVAVNATPAISDILPITDDTVSLLSTILIAIISLWKVIKKPKPKQN